MTFKKNHLLFFYILEGQYGKFDIMNECFFNELKNFNYLWYRKERLLPSTKVPFPKRRTFMNGKREDAMKTY